jgi:hypothetical protein
MTRFIQPLPRLASLLCMLTLAGHGLGQTKPTAKPGAKVPLPAANTTKPAAASTGAKGAVGPIAPMPKFYTPTKLREVDPKYPWKEKIPTTVFWIGEMPTQNNPVPNHKSAWDVNWQANFGGYDDPNPANRSWDFAPKGFTPKQNPFYVALPFNDVTNREVSKQKIPWHKARWKGESSHSVCRSQWLLMRHGSRYCYAQWEDVGPWETDDADYVFGNARPKNIENDGAGLDVSPAVRDYLGLTSGGLCDWRFVEANEVPDGPWRRFGTNNPFVRSESAEQDRIRREYAALLKARDAYLDAQIQKRIR